MLMLFIKMDKLIKCVVSHTICIVLFFFKSFRMRITSFKFKEKFISIIADISILTLSSDTMANGGFDFFTWSRIENTIFRRFWCRKLIDWGAIKSILCICFRLRAHFKAQGFVFVDDYFGILQCARLFPVRLAHIEHGFCNIRRLVSGDHNRQNIMKRYDEKTCWTLLFMPKSSPINERAKFWFIKF